MPLFRQHRGHLIDSLKTTVIVDSMIELIEHLGKIAVIKKAFHIQIEPYPAEGENFDKRTGWYNQVVTDEEGVIGFLSEPLRR